MLMALTVIAGIPPRFTVARMVDWALELMVVLTVTQRDWLTAPRPYVVRTT